MRYRTLSLLFVLFALTFAQIACIPQDCMGGSLEVKGTVINTNGNPVVNAQIAIKHKRDYSDPFEQTLFSDEEGNFTSDLFFMYACETMTVEVEAEGYVKWSGKYNGPFDDILYPLPETLTIELVPIESQP
jgi:hypothetical protein